MAFTAKMAIWDMADAGDNQTRLRFNAPYNDKDGNRINEEWAKYTPALNLDMTVMNEVVEAQALEIGDSFTVRFDKEN
jgi:hypothetical protein